METGAPWECCLAAEAIFYVMKGYLKISVSGLSCSQFEKRLTLRQSWNMNCKMSYQKKIVCRMCFSEGAEKKKKRKKKQKHKHSHLQLSFISTFRAVSHDHSSHLHSHIRLCKSHLMFCLLRLLISCCSQPGINPED